MNFIIFCICIPLVHSVSHSFMTTYNGIYGKTIVGIPEFSSVTTLDEKQIDSYDSDTGTLIQDWMKEFASGDRWKEYTEVRERVQQINKLNIIVLMQQFSQSQGVHRYQRMYGCVWDDETEVSDGFDEYSYDGQRFISLDLKEGRYTAHVPQADPTVQKWNNDTQQLDFMKQYYKHECINWLKEFLHFLTKSLTKPIEKNPSLDDSGSSSHASHFMYAAIIILLILILILLCTILKYWKKRKCFQQESYYREYDYSTLSNSASHPDDPSEQHFHLQSEAQNHFPELQASQFLTSRRVFTALPKNEVL